MSVGHEGHQFKSWKFYYMSWIQLICKLPVSIYSIRTQKCPLSQSPHESACTLVLITSITLMTFIIMSNSHFASSPHVQNNHYKKHCKPADVGSLFASHCILRSYLCYSLQEYLHVTSQISTSLSGLLSFMLVCGKTLSLMLASFNLLSLARRSHPLP